MKDSDSSTSLKELASTVPGYTGYGESENRIHADSMFRFYLHDRLMQGREIVETTMMSLLNKELFEAAGTLESIGRTLFRVAISIKYRSYRHCRLFLQNTRDENIYKTLINLDQRCLNIMEDITNFIKTFSSDLLSKGMIEEELFCADFFFDELIKQFNRAVVHRDYFILDAEKMHL